MADWTPAKQEKILGNNPRITILNTVIDVLNVQETIELVEEYVKKKEPLHLMGVNADKINEVNENERLKQIVNSCGIINADGASVIKASKYLKKPLPERVAGIDLMQSLVKLSEEKGYSVYLLGAKQEVVDKTAEVLKTQYPKLNLLGVHNGYFKEPEWPEISKELKSLRPDFVFVGITSPMKEYLIEYLQDDGNDSVFMGVGGSFDVISGFIPRAPKWMQKSGLEWLFRVMQEPKRLFKRYFVGNLTFIKAVRREKRKKVSNHAEKIKVLMVGTDKSTKGGMWTVASNYINSSMYNENVDLKYIPTFVVGSFVKRLVFTFIAYIKILVQLFFNTPQILHVHMSERGSVYRKGIVINMAKLFKTKVIIHMHGAEFQVWYDSLKESKKKKVRNILNKGDAILILGKYWEKFVASLVSADKVFVLYNAVPHHENIYDSNGSTLLFLGVVGQRKGAYDLVKAFSEVINDIPEKIQLVFYGPDFEHNIERLISTSGHDDRIFYKGWLDGAQKEAVFKDTICNILPSYNEGLPMTILETMAAGIPSISTDVAAIPEVVTDENGFVIIPGDIEALKEAIKNLCNDEKKRVYKSSNAYKTIEDFFTIEKNVKKILEIYRRVLL